MRPLQEKIIQELKVKPTIDPQVEIDRTLRFLVEYQEAHPFLKGYVLGISGGQDSTLAGRLAQLAVEALNQKYPEKGYHFYAVRLPYGIQADEADAMDAIHFIQPTDYLRVDVKPAVDVSVKNLESAGVPVSDFNKGNIKARERMITQYAIAGAYSCAVIGTDHAAESVTGFYTKFGDGGADLLPLWRLDKRQGREMLALLQAPRHLYEKTPIADLEEEHPAQPDEVALGVTYQEIDDYLEGKEISQVSAEKIEAWYTKTKHKRHLPVTIYDDFWKIKE